MCPRPTDQEMEQMPTWLRQLGRKTTAEILQKLNQDPRQPTWTLCQGIKLQCDDCLHHFSSCNTFYQLPEYLETKTVINDKVFKMGIQPIGNIKLKNNTKDTAPYFDYK